MEHTPAVGGTDTLVDIRDVTVDRELSREDRIAEFVRQIKTLTVSSADSLPSTPVLLPAAPRWRNVSKESCGKPDIFQ